MSDDCIFFRAPGGPIHQARQNSIDARAGGSDGLLPDFKASLQLAIEEAGSLGHQHPGTGHLLLGLLREGAGISSQVLLKSGVTLEQARELVTQLHADEDELAAD
ncbi:MAG TPA: Clp protease N-terminal domain-containing protein [Chloroflexota bacterium]|nr:Clp protease N-terminal domain-containing protein [Chloroflexota bacterium]